MVLVYRYLILVKNETMIKYFVAKTNTHTRSSGYMEMEYFVNELKSKGFKTIPTESQDNVLINNIFPDIYIVLMECKSCDLDTTEINKVKQRLEKNFPRMFDLSPSNIIIKTIDYSTQEGFKKII